MKQLNRACTLHLNLFGHAVVVRVEEGQVTSFTLQKDMASFEDVVKFFNDLEELSYTRLIKAGATTEEVRSVEVPPPAMRPSILEGPLGTVLTADPKVEINDEKSTIIPMKVMEGKDALTEGQLRHSLSRQTSFRAALQYLVEQGYNTQAALTAIVMKIKLDVPAFVNLKSNIEPRIIEWANSNKDLLKG